MSVSEHVPANLLAGAISRIVAGQSLPADVVVGVMKQVLAGEAAEVQVAGLLIALRMKGETAEEIAAAAGILRERMIELPNCPPNALDTCGTGSDGSGTLNISTAAAIVAVAAGACVVKNGNRAVTSATGSADVLSALGIDVNNGLEIAAKCLRETGFTFCFAPLFHPAMRAVANVRRTLGVRTLFNCLGPLLNPGRTRYQVLGVGQREWLEPMAGAVARLGTERTLLVHGLEGLDEVSLAGPTLVRDVRGGRVQACEWSARDFGLATCAVADLQVRDATESASVIRGVLDGIEGPARRVILANAAAGLFVCELASSLRDGVERAAAAIDDGKASQLLANLVAFSASAQ